MLCRENSGRTRLVMAVILGREIPGVSHRLVHGLCTKIGILGCCRVGVGLAECLLRPHIVNMTTAVINEELMGSHV